MTCPAPTRGVIPIALIIPDNLAWDIRWDTFDKYVGGAKGPEGCCDCGAIMQTDLIARIIDGRTMTWGVESPPSMSDPSIVRHVPWIKARFASSGGCHSARRVWWSDVGRIGIVGSDKGCLSFHAPRDVDGIEVIVDPAPGQLIEAPPDHTIWAVWVDYEIRCCNCYDDAPWKLTDSATIPIEGSYDFIAPPYSNSVQIHFAHFFGPSSFGIEIIDAAGNTLWSTTTTADLYTMRWPNAHALRITGAREPITVLWEGA